MTHLVRRALAALAALLLTLAAQTAEVTVSAASSLTNAFQELAPLFEAANPRSKVQLNFGASGALLQQLRAGAPVDVFASADQDRMDQAEESRLIVAGARRDFVSNALVVVVPASGGKPPARLADLTGPAYARIAIGLPASVPVGTYTRAVLEGAGLWSAIEPKMIGANNVRQALDYVARGEVDAAFVYATDAALMRDKVRVALTVPTAEPIRYPVAPLATAPQPELARRFVEFLGSPQAQAVLERYGFGKP